MSKIILGPDFPTGGELICNSAMNEVYLRGRGSVTVRGVIKNEEINLGEDGSVSRKQIGIDYFLSLIMQKDRIFPQKDSTFCL